MDQLEKDFPKEEGSVHIEQISQVSNLEFFSVQTTYVTGPEKTGLI